MEEMKLLYQKYHYKSVIFLDDEFLINPKWVKNFCQAMHDYGFAQKKIKWWAAVRADMICRFPEIIREMKQAGLDTISIGFESFSDRLLKWMNKGTTAEINFKAAEITKKLGLKIYANTIFGLPYKDKKWYIEDDLVTLEAIKKIKPHNWAYSYFTPIPGSSFYDWFKKNNLILKDSPEISGLRFANQPKIKGVDYQKLKKMVLEYSHQRNQSLAKRVIKKTLKTIGIWNLAKKYYNIIKTRGQKTYLDIEERITLGKSPEFTTKEHLARYFWAKKFTKNKIIIDAACGTGYGSEILKAKYYLGLDNSREAIKFAKKHYNGDFRILDLDKQKLPKKRVDVIISFETLEHLNQPENFLMNAKKSLKSGGLFIFSVPLTERRGENPFHKHVWREEEIKKIINKYFSNCDFDYQHKEEISKTTFPSFLMGVCKK
jgi:radical SAM superfamily enzyme YgiQ (UPF0313 family)